MATIYHEETADTMPTSGAHKFANFKKSIDMLNDAVNTPRSLLQSGTLRHVDYTPSSIFEPSNNTYSFASGSITPSRKQTLGTSTLLATPGSSLRHSFLAQTIEEEMTTTNIDMDEEPVIAASNAMFVKFMESYKSATAQHELFEPVVGYEAVCQQGVALLKKLAKQTVPSNARYMNLIEMWSLLKSEQQTWRLVSSLYRDRIDSANQTDDSMLLDISVKHISDKKLIDALFEHDADLRQAQLVVDWLEHSMGDMLEDFYDKVDFHIDRMGAWENTLHMLKQQKMVGNRLPASRTFVDRLDPDAPLRQGKQLLDLDVEDDVHLLEYMFACVRAGQIDEAQRVCIKVGHMWRAAALNGWRLYHDPNVEGLGPGGSVQKVEGNPYRDIWKKACWKASEDERLPSVERALNAALCGNLRQLLPYLNSWHDYLWAYFKVMVDQRVENHIRASYTGRRQLTSLPDSYVEESFTVEKIFCEIQACLSEKIRKECNTKYHLIQKYIITGNIDGLVEEMYEWCRSETSQSNKHFIRFMAHLVLFLRNVGINTKEELCTSILETYVKLLMDEKQIELVATYVATLPRALQIECYARFLEGIHQSDERRHCLELAEQCGLDVLQITKLVVENVRNADSNDIIADVDFSLEAVTTDEDMVKIEALEWLIMNPVQRSEALKQANAMMRVFIATRKLQACRQALRKIPRDSYDVIRRVWRSQTGDGSLPAEDSNAFREYLCIQAYLDAHDSFTDWFAHYHHSCPKPPEIGLGANFSERVAYEHRQREHNMELERWQHSLDLQTKATVDKIYNVLLFVDGGWMVDSQTDGQVDEVRAQQMVLLRQLCLPSMCLLLHQVLHTTKRYKDCVQIADCIASEQHQLYKVFRTDEMQNILKKIRLSAIALLDAGLDPLGYPLS